MIRQAGPDQVAVILQGKLDAGDAIAEAGLAAQPRQPKPAPQAGLPAKGFSNGR